jgi:hypothetical protein
MWLLCFTSKMLEARALPEVHVKTSHPQSWHESRWVWIHGKEVRDLRVSAHSKSVLTSTPQEVKSTLFHSVRGDGIDWKAHIPDLHVSVKDRLIIPALKLENVETMNCKFGQVLKVLSYQQKLEENCILNLFDKTSFPELPN